MKNAFSGKSVEAYMGGTDVVSIKSGTLTKEQAKKLQLDAREKNVLPRNDWNSFNTKELALNIGKNAGLAGLNAAIITTGFDLVAKKVQGEQIDADTTIETALKTVASKVWSGAKKVAGKIGSGVRSIASRIGGLFR